MLVTLGSPRRTSRAIAIELGALQEEFTALVSGLEHVAIRYRDLFTLLDGHNRPEVHGKGPKIKFPYSIRRTTKEWPKTISGLRI